MHTHLSKDQLAAFAVGKLELNVVVEVEKHLSDCATCLETLQLVQDDTFVDLVRGFGDSPARDALDAVLQSLSRYDVHRLLGNGGMGAVYLAEHRLMQRMVALKVINPRLVVNPITVERFHRETQAAARLHHPNIVTAFDAEQVGDVHFLVMEYVPGTNLAQEVKQRGPLPLVEACDYIRQAAQGLQAALDGGMVHRDIKPHNLMRTPLGQIKILDFGLATLTTQPHPDADMLDAEQVDLNAALTQTGTIMGTPDFIAPEQIVDAHSADIRADIYSLGCTLYYLLAGQVPFPGGKHRDKLLAQLRSELTPITQVRPEVPPELDCIVKKMMAKDRNDRYQTPDEVAVALSRFLETPLQNQAQPQVMAQPRKRRPLAATLVGLAAVFVCLVAASIIFIRTQYGTVRIEVNDPTIKINLVGDRYEIDNQGETITITPGKHSLSVARGKLKFDTKKFELGSGKNATLRVEYLEGDIVITKGDKVLERWNGQIPTVEPKPIAKKPPVDEKNMLLALPGHAAPVTGVKYSSDGTFAVSVDSGGSARVWDMDRMKEKQQFKMHGAAILSLDIAAKSRRVATGDAKGNVHVWDAAIGNAFRSWQRHKGAVQALAFSPDGMNVASGSADQTVSIDSIVNGSVVHDFIEPFGGVQALAYSPDGRWLAVGSKENRMRVWDTETKKLYFDKITDGAVQHVDWSPDGSLLEFTVADKLPTIHLMKFPNTKNIRIIRSRGLSPGAAFTPDGRFLVLGSFDKNWKVVDVTSGQEVHNHSASAPFTTHLDVSPDGKTVLMGGGQLPPGKGSKKNKSEGDYDLRLFELPEKVWPLPKPKQEPIAEILNDAHVVMNFEKDSFYQKDGQTWVHDLSGRGNDALCPALQKSEPGTTYSPTGAAGGALDCNGKTIKLPRPFIINQTEFTITFWAWDEGVGPNGENLRPVFQEFHTYGKVVRPTFRIALEGTRATAGYNRGDKWDDVQTPFQLVPRKEWFFVAVRMVKTRQNQRELIITINDQHSKIMRGGSQSTTKAHDEIGGIVGKIDELAIFPRGLSDSELQQLYSWGQSGRLLTKNPTVPQLTIKPAGQYPSKSSASSLVVYPDGTRFLSVHAQPFVRVWDLAQAKIAGAFSAHKALVTCAAIDSGGKLAASADENGNIWIWDPVTLKPIRGMANPGEPIRELHFLSTTRLLSATDCCVRIWDIDKAKIENTMALGYPVSVCVSPSGRLAVLGDRDGVILWDTTTGRIHRRLRGPTGRVWALAFAPDCRSFVTGDDDGVITLWDVEKQEVIRRFQGVVPQLRSLAFLSDGRHVLSGGGDGTVRIWEVSTGEEIARSQEATPGTSQLALLPDGRAVLTAPEKDDKGKPSEEFAIRRWELPESVWSKVPPVKSTGTDPKITPTVELAKIHFLQSWKGHTGTGRGHTMLAASADSNRLLSACLDDPIAWIWNTKTGKTILTMDMGKNRPRVIDLSADGTRAVVPGGEGKLVIWDVDAGKKLHEIDPGHSLVNSVAFSPDGKRLVAMIPKGKSMVVAWDVKTGKKVAEREVGAPCTFGRFLPGSDTLLIASYHGVIRWDLRTNLTVTYEARSTAPLSTILAISSDGKRVAYSAVDPKTKSHQIEIREVDGGKILRTLTGHEKQLNNLYFLPGDRYLASSGRNNILQVWDIETGQLVIRNEGIDDQWHAFVPLSGGRLASLGYQEDIARGEIRIHELPPPIRSDERTDK